MNDRANAQPRAGVRERRPTLLHGRALSIEGGRALWRGEPYEGLAFEPGADGLLLPRRYRGGRLQKEAATPPLAHEGERIVDRSAIAWDENDIAFWNGQAYGGLLAAFEDDALRDLERFAEGDTPREGRVRFHPDGAVATWWASVDLGEGAECVERYTFDETGVCVGAMLEIDDERPIAAIRSDGEHLELLLYAEAYFDLEARLARAVRHFEQVSLSRAEWMALGARLVIGGLAAAHERTIVEGLAARMSGGALEALEVWHGALGVESLSRLLEAGAPERVEVKWAMPGARERLLGYLRERGGAEVELDGVRLCGGRGIEVHEVLASAPVNPPETRFHDEGYARVIGWMGHASNLERDWLEAFAGSEGLEFVRIDSGKGESARASLEELKRRRPELIAYSGRRKVGGGDR